MALVVEDGTGLENAESYVEVSYIDEYAEKYGKTGWSDLAGPVKDSKARVATQFVDNVYLDHLSPVGHLQRLYVPASNLNVRGTRHYGIPVQLKDAVAELAIISVTVNLSDVQSSRNPIQITKKAGDVSKSETFSNDVYKKVFHPVEMLLRPIMDGASKLGEGFGSFGMGRA